MALTDTTLRNLKPLDKAYNKADGGGLRIAVMPNGTKTWRLDYRFCGTRKTLTIGPYPTVSLVEARAQREEAKKLLRDGVDPGVKKKLDAAALEREHKDTFKAVCDDYLQRLRDLDRSANTMVKNTWVLNEVCKPLHKRPIRQITTPELFTFLSGIEKSGRRETAVTARSMISRVFRMAILTGRADNDPTYALRGVLTRPKVKSHAALLGEKEVGGLMHAIHGYNGWASLKGLLLMQAYTFCRPTETRKMNLSEIDFYRRVWTVPAERAKMRRPHEVYLSDQALKIIEDMRPLIGEEGDVFPSMRSGNRFLSENSMNSALRRMGFTHDEHTAHGFRSTASSLLNASGLFSVDAIEMQLAHLETNKVRRTYNRHDYWEERVKMMQWWADYLDRLAREVTQR